jgi:type IV secretory pathway TrbD component
LRQIELSTLYLLVLNSINYLIAVTVLHNYMERKTRIEVNRALRRRAKMMGIPRDVAIVLALIVVFCLFLGYLKVPGNIVTAIFVTLFFTAILSLKDGMADVLARNREPKNYTRGCLNYRSPSVPLGKSPLSDLTPRSIARQLKKK